MGIHPFWPIGAYAIMQLFAIVRATKTVIFVTHLKCKMGGGGTAKKSVYPFGENINEPLTLSCTGKEYIIYSHISGDSIHHGNVM